MDKFTGKMRIDLAMIFYFLSFVLCELACEVWSIWLSHHYCTMAISDTLHASKIVHISKTKSHKKKTQELKNYFQSNAHLS